MNGAACTPKSLEQMRPLLSIGVSVSKRKELGQCFTGLRTGRLLAALSLSRSHRSILDPMAGHGDLLEAAAERASRLKSNPKLFGIEIESDAAQLGNCRLSFCRKEFGTREGSIIHGNAFATATWNQLVAHLLFDLVIANPPYVRYQTQASGRANGSSRADDIRAALSELAKRLAPVDERALWEKLITNYSGLADLSLPSWLLCGLVTAPGGILALVVPQTWLSRDYAKLARYFFLRFFAPVAVVQESGQRWFSDALVPVSLVIGRRLSTDEVLTPLFGRTPTLANTPFVEIAGEASSLESHVGSAFPGRDPEGRFASWVRRGAQGAKVGIKATNIAWTAQRDEIGSLCRGADWYQDLEGASTDPNHIALAVGHTLPSAIGAALPEGLLRAFQSLNESPISIGQGLRTGCNDFFYVDEPEDTGKRTATVVTSELFGRRALTVPEAVLRPVVRKQAELAGSQISIAKLRGRVLDLRGYFLPEDIERFTQTHRNGSRRLQGAKTMPAQLAEYVRVAARTKLTRGDVQTLIPLLSAVKPNGLGPEDEWSNPLGLEIEAPRMWYMLPAFAPRHQGAVFLPRIIHEAPAAVCNTDPSVLIDANFSTFWSCEASFSRELIYGLLSNTWAEFCMEALGTPLGGGALKLEATQLRQLPLPLLSERQRVDVISISQRLLATGRTPEMMARLDNIIISALGGRRIAISDTHASASHLRELITSLRKRRRLRTVAQTS